MPNKPHAGKVREELKEKTKDVLGKGCPGIIDPPEDSAFKTLETASNQGDSVVSRGGVEITPEKKPEPEKRGGPEVISKPEAELLARKFTDKKKEDTLPLEKTIAEVKSRNSELQRLKTKKKRQSMKVIRQLRSLDPPNKKTCGFCGVRVLVKEMDSKKELCEVCAS